MVLVKSLIFLCSVAAVVSARSAANAVVSGAIFVGTDTTESPVDTYEIFNRRRNHITGVSSVLAYSGQLADFNPAEKPAKSLALTLDSFVQKVSTFPSFFLTRNLEQSIFLNGSFVQFEKEIRDVDDSVTNLPLIARSFRDLIPGHIQDSSLMNWVLSLVVLENNEYSNSVTFKLARVTMTLATDSYQSTSIPPQNARILIAEFGVNGDGLIRNAESLGNIIPKVVSPRNAVDFFSSPKVLVDDTMSGWVDWQDLASIFSSRHHKDELNW